MGYWSIVYNDKTEPDILILRWKRKTSEAVSKVSKKINPLSDYKKSSRRYRKSTQIKKESVKISDICGRTLHAEQVYAAMYLFKAMME